MFANAHPGSRWILNADDPAVLGLAVGVPGERFLFSTSGRVEKGACLGSDDVMTCRLPGREEMWLEAGTLQLLGGHNVANALAAGLACALAGLASFAALEHRLQPIGERDDVLWVNDSKATNVTAARLALRSFERPVVLILGGRHKGEPYTRLGDPPSRLRAVIAFGEATPLIVSDLQGIVEVLRVEHSLEDAVRTADTLARSGDAVLLAPACSSFPSIAGRGLSLVTASLVVFGLLSVYSASSHVALRKGLEDSHYLFQQMSRAGIGLLALGVASIVDYRVYRRLAWPILGFTVLLLASLILPGTESIAPRVNGARRWLDLGLSVQPSELAKISVVLWTAAIAVKKQDRLLDFRHGLLPCLLIVGFVCLLVLLQPHFSAAVMIAAAAATVLFTAGARVRHFAALAAAALPVVWLQIAGSGYRLARVTAFLHPDSTAAEGGYQLNQSLIAVGSGGMLGVGFGRSSLKMSYLPEPQNDFIFSIIAEEWGFVGAAAIIILFLVWALLGLRISRSASDPYGRLVAVGITTLVALGAFAHIGVALGLLPTTGVNLPFISAGGTNLILMLGATGILLNVSKGRA